MKPLLKWILAFNLLTIAALVFVFPQLMVSPGKLTAAHAHLETDCFACHAPLRGSAAERCATCHKPADIGRLTSVGKPINRAKSAVPFHQKLLQQDCVACHSDHAGVERFRSKGRFDHALLDKTTREQCQTCHKNPSDALHEKLEGNCLQCHEQNRWKPATFDHDKYFLLDRDHNASCTTCHERNDFRRYTCYGCHEHTPGKIRSEHEEEGIRDYENCVECHRSADEHDIRGRGKGEGGGERRRQRDREHGD